MRLPGWLLVVFVLALPAVAPAQTVKREDLVGTWLGKTDMGVKLRALWKDGLWWGNHGGGRWRLVGDTLWLGDDWRYGYGGIILRTGIPQADTVDTLKMPWFMKYLANDPHYWTGTEKERAELYGKFYEHLSSEDKPDDQRVDMVGMSEAEYRSYLMGGFASHISVFKVSLSNGRLTLDRLDSLSDGYTPPYALGPREKQGVYERSDSLVPWM